MLVGEIVKLETPYCMAKNDSKALGHTILKLNIRVVQDLCYLKFSVAGVGSEL